MHDAKHGLKPSLAQTRFHGYTGLALECVRILGKKETDEIFLSAERVDKVEALWRRRFDRAIESTTRDILLNAGDTGRLALEGVDFSALVMEHSYDVMRLAIIDAGKRLPTVPNESRLATGNPPPAKVPRNFRELRVWWDVYRRKKVIPPRQRAIAERIKKAYLKKVQEVWVQYGEAFRKGEAYERRAAVDEMMRGADVVYGRAKMIVETETTYYYNKTRTAIYDLSPDVEHYLFLCVRDHRTTPWCRTRHGLVYEKGSDYLKRERPPCHWNCRSEVIPLTRHNPRHRALIDDASRARKYSTPKPLPEEWTGR